jgi:NADPH-dependent F420 reductase
LTAGGDLPTVAVVGGTGDLGGGLARRLARTGYTVVIGSRSADKAAVAAAELAAIGDVRGLNNRDAAAAADIVILTVPFATQGAILDDIRPVVGGKIVVDTTVPLQPPKVSRVQLPAEGSAAQIAQSVLGDSATVVSAFHNVSAAKLAKDEAPDCDILVFTDDKEAGASVVDLIARIGMRGLRGGPLANSAAAEAMTSVLIAINRRYKVSDGAGIRVTGELTGA